MKPCPFCGKPAKLGGSDDVNGSPYWYVYCSNLECGGNMFGGVNKEEVIEKWNRRAYESTSNTAES